MRLELDGVTRPGLLFVGATGVHKSCLAYMIYRELLSQGITADWWLATKLIEAEQDTYDDDFSGDRNTFLKACRTPLLILDDLGDKRPSGAVLEISPNRQEIMFKLFEHREAKNLPTIATTNLKKGELYTHFGDRVASRILGLCHIIPMIGKDSRVEGESDE
jgi:DNA replication protein DnaC